MKERFLVIVTVVSLVGWAPAQTNQKPSKPVERFVTLGGNEQVGEFFRKFANPFSALFRAASDCLTEQEILITSHDPSVDRALVAVVRGKDSVRGGFAAFLICKRTQFVDHREFPVQRINGYRYSTYAPNGLFNPYVFDFSRVSAEARDAVSYAIDSTDERLRTSARLYCGDFQKEMERRSTPEIGALWRDAVLSLRYPIYYTSEGSEEAERGRVLTTILIGRGIEGASVLARLLQSEQKPIARQLEVQVILEIDHRSTRLRGSEQGRRVIDAVGTSLGKDEFYVSRTPEERNNEWLRFRASVLDDDYGVTTTDRLVFESFRTFYGEPAEKLTPGRIRHFRTELTRIDPTFPSWEYVSTGGEQDMLHPRFRQKIDRYYTVWKSMASQEKESSSNSR